MLFPCVLYNSDHHEGIDSHMDYGKAIRDIVAADLANATGIYHTGGVELDEQCVSAGVGVNEINIHGSE